MARDRTQETSQPSREAMMAAVELEIASALGRVHTVKIGRMIQKAIDAALSTSQPNRMGTTPWHQEPSDDEKIDHAEQTLAANRMGTTPEMQKMYDEFGGDRKALAKMVYEAVRFANWAAGEGFSPSPDCTEAIDPAIILSDCINSIEHFDGDDWNRLAGIASDALLSAALAATPAVGGDVLRDAIMGAARLYTHDHTTAHKITETAMETLAGQPASPLRGECKDCPHPDFCRQQKGCEVEACLAGAGLIRCTCPCSCDETPHDGKPCLIHDAAAPAAGGEREALQTALAFIDTALVADENPTMSKRAVMRIINEALAARPASPLRGRDSLETLIREYARDLRRNSSGGDDYPWEYARGTADYLEVLICRASPPEQPAAARDEGEAMEAYSKSLGEPSAFRTTFEKGHSDDM